jgi:hypothetical protein
MINRFLRVMTSLRLSFGSTIERRRARLIARTRRALRAAH